MSNPSTRSNIKCVEWDATRKALVSATAKNLETGFLVRKGAEEATKNEVIGYYWSVIGNKFFLKTWIRKVDVNCYNWSKHKILDNNFCDQNKAHVKTNGSVCDSVEEDKNVFIRQNFDSFVTKENLYLNIGDSVYLFDDGTFTIKKKFVAVQEQDATTNDNENDEKVEVILSEIDELIVYSKKNPKALMVFRTKKRLYADASMIISGFKTEKMYMKKLHSGLCKYVVVKKGNCEAILYCRGTLPTAQYSSSAGAKKKPLASQSVACGVKFEFSNGIVDIIKESGDHLLRSNQYGSFGFSNQKIEEDSEKSDFLKFGDEIKVSVSSGEVKVWQIALYTVMMIFIASAVTFCVFLIQKIRKAKARQNSEST